MPSLQATISLTDFLRLMGLPELQPWQRELLENYIGLSQEQAAQVIQQIVTPAPKLKQITAATMLPKPVTGKKITSIVTDEAVGPTCSSCGKPNDTPAFKACSACRDRWRKNQAVKDARKRADKAAPERPAPQNYAGGRTAKPNASRPVKWTDERLLEIAAMRNAGKHPKEIAVAMQESLANVYFYLSKALQLSNDQRLLPADQAQLISACRMMQAPITVVDGVVRCEGEEVDLQGLLAFTNVHRAKNKLPLYKLEAA